MTVVHFNANWNANCLFMRAMMATKPVQFKLVLTHIGLVSHTCADETVVIPLLMTHCVTNSSVSIIASGDTGMDKAPVEIRPLLGFNQSGNK